MVITGVGFVAGLLGAFLVGIALDSVRHPLRTALIACALIAVYLIR